MDAQLLLTEGSLPEYLRGLGLAAAGERVRVEAAGDGNINWVRRATVRRVSVSLLRPEAGPSGARERSRSTRRRPSGSCARPATSRGCSRSTAEAICPRVHHFDEPNRVLVLEDLGRAERLDSALARGADVSAAFGAPRRASSAASTAATRGDASLAARFANEPMQRLHGDHIFALPYQPNDFPLPPRTRRARRAAARRRGCSCASAARAYARYLEPVGAFVHGDVQAGNVLLPAGGVKLLDAEIAHSATRRSTSACCWLTR